MENEKGSPVFENIDEILAEKIIHHTQNSADTSDSSGDSSEDSISATHSTKKRFTFPVFYATLFICIVTAVILLLSQKIVFHDNAPPFKT